MNPPRVTREQFSNFVKVTLRGIDFLNTDKAKSPTNIQIVTGSPESNIRQGNNVSNEILNRTYNLRLDLKQMDLITLLLLQQLRDSGIPHSDLDEINSSYGDLRKDLKTGSYGRVSAFLSKINKLNTHVKENPQYLSIVSTLLSLWKSLS